jgi:hypothetical protein
MCKKTRHHYVLTMLSVKKDVPKFANKEPTMEK